MLLLCMLQFSLAFSQDVSNRYFIESGRKYEKIPFVFSGNQIILELKLNGSKPLKFILDSGVKTPIMLDVPQFDTIRINDYKRISVQGLGQGDGIAALIAYNNTINIGSHIVNNNQTVIVLLEDIFHLSNKLGHDINGIIGFDIFRDFIVEINYDKRYLKLWDPKRYKYSKSKKYVTKPLSFKRGKPYVYLDVEMEKGKFVPVKLLVDTGGSDALWLFAESHEDISHPEKYIPDFLGSGLSGDIYGKRSRVAGLHIGELKLKDVTVSYPDSSSVSFVMVHKERNGSIGGGALNRFKVIIDYTNKKISFKKGNLFKRPFHYNMCGIELKMPFPDMPIYEVSEVRKGSPAAEMGVVKGDMLKEVNYKNTSSMSFPEIMSKFRTRDGETIRLILDRNGEEIKVKLKLKKAI
ncbi:MAG: aspartyl protease family protein [Flavobacteriales bacterium]|nr:aspartyl protease family protein [Flavobacteriales bacterium]